MHQKLIELIESKHFQNTGPVGQANLYRECIQELAKEFVIVYKNKSIVRINDEEHNSNFKSTKG